MESTANVSQKTLKRLAQYMLKTRMNQHTVTTQKETIQPVKIWVDFTSNNHLTFLWFSYKNLGWFMLNQAVKIAQSLGHPLDPEVTEQGCLLFLRLRVRNRWNELASRNYCQQTRWKFLLSQTCNTYSNQP